MAIINDRLRNTVFDRILVSFLDRFRDTFLDRFLDRFRLTRRRASSSVGVVQTAYANGASAAFLREAGATVALAKTGVIMKTVTGELDAILKSIPAPVAAPAPPAPAAVVA